MKKVSKLSRLAIRSGIVSNHRQAQTLFLLIAIFCLCNSTILVIFGLTVGGV